MTSLFRRSARCLGLVFVAGFVTAQAQGPHFAGDSPRDFVQGFYAWYVPRAQNQDTTSGWDETLRLIRPDISPQLAKLLEENSAAQSKCKDLVGLDFDPFLYTQEPAEHYEEADIVQTKTAYSAKIYRLEAGQRAEKPDAVAEFVQKDGHWFFVNLRYPGGSDLLTVLKSRPKCLTPK
jgi:hypothetical protein